jgi:L-arabinose isomerase
MMSQLPAIVRLAPRHRTRITRTAGSWRDSETQGETLAWCRAATGWYESQHLKVARFGDNVLEVAVTDGDKVAEQIQFRYSVYGFGVGDLVAYMN